MTRTDLTLKQQQVPLHSASADEHGRPVHGDCYLEQKLEKLVQNNGRVERKSN